jgi:cytidylate kinase
VTASPVTRSQRLAKALGLDNEAAMRKVDESDAARADYLRRFYKVRHELPIQYDLVINTDKLRTDEAAALIHAAGLNEWIVTTSDESGN